MYQTTQGLPMTINTDTTTRKVASVPLEMSQKIADFRFSHRFNTESDAIRFLLEKGLKAAEEDGPGAQR
jgi:hypothetical protein